MVMLALARVRRRRIRGAAGVPQARRWTGCWPCNRGTAAGRPSTPTTTGSSSATFRSPITTPCSIPPAPISPAGCWRRWRRTAWTASHPAVQRGMDWLITQSGARRQLVRPLGRRLHLRHVFRAARPGGGGRRRSRGAHPARRRMAALDPECRRRLGRKLRQLRQRRVHRRRARRRRPRGRSWD